MIRINKILIIGICAAIVSGTLFATTSEVKDPSVVLVAGHTIEIPLSSNLPIPSDLTANGEFQSGDVTFTAGPGCHLSAHGCTLLISAAPTSKDYIDIPVTVSASRLINKPIFKLSVIQPAENVSFNADLPENYSISLLISNQIDNEGYLAINDARQYSLSTLNFTQERLQRSGNVLFYGVAEPHPGLLNIIKDASHHYTVNTNGPVYQIVSLTNHDVTQPLSISITGSGANSFSIDNEASDYGVNKNCIELNSITSGDSCLLIIKGKVGDPSKAPETATLTIQGNNNNLVKFKLTATTYVYAGGGFNTLGNASVLGGDLLAECTAGTCSNALQGSTGYNYSSHNLSVGNWINALAITPAGNLMVGGVFGAIGGATTGAVSGVSALLAQCIPGPLIGNSCINQIGSTSNSYAFNNGYIDAITSPFAISTNNFIAVGGDFSQIRSFSAASGGRLLAKCGYSGTSSNQTCNSYIGSGTTNISKYANNAIVALNTLGSISSVPQVNAGGLFTQIADYPSSVPSGGTIFASCSSGASGVCSKGMGSYNPNSSILGMTDDGESLYIGGAFTQAGTYVESNGGYPLLKCTLGSTTTCVNALAGTEGANGYIEGITYSGGNLYVGGKFTTIGSATPVSSGNMLAVCTPGGTCSNFVTDTNPYATGLDWGGNISAIAVGVQTTITAD